MALLHVGQDERAGFFYYVMELADDAATGRTIDPASYVPLTAKEVKTRRGRLPPAECVAFGIELARSLAGLHARRLLHRDIKPSNVIVVGGVPKLADIGLVSSSTEARTFVGTEGFVPPEGPGSPSADVFALGKVLYELATGLDRSEFPKLPDDLSEPREQRALFELNEILLQACEASAAARYRDAAALLADLEALHAGRSLRSRRVGGWALRVAAAIVVVGIGAFALREKFSGTEIIPPSAGGTPTAPTAASAPAVSDQSLVILPLENLSSDPSHTYFPDGLHAEIISTLQGISGLKVISRHSAQHDKDSRLPLARIAQELGVANVIVGSVRREKDTLRILLELRRAGDEALLWSLPKADRTLTEVLTLQTAIADQVARVLVAREAKGMVATARHTTKSPAAFEFYLRMNEVFWKNFDDRETMLESIRLARQAFELDSTYVSAAQQLGVMHGMLYMRHAKDAAERASFKAEALKWGETASRLAPGGAGDGALVQYYAQVEHDYPRAIALAKNGLRAAPNDATMWNFYASALGTMARRGEEWRTTIARFEAIGRKEAPQMRGRIVLARFRLFGELPTDFSGMSALTQADWLLRARQSQAALALIERELSAGEKPPATLLALQLRRSDALRQKGDTAGAMAAAKAAVALAEELSRAPNANPSTSATALADAWLRAGRLDEAVAAARRAVDAISEATEARRRQGAEVQLAGVLAQAGRTRECLELLAKLLRLPSGLTVPMLRIDPLWDHLRDEVSFKALLADPRNSAPL